jgi:hypothetical protein
MSNDPAYTRRVAQENHTNNPHTPMATEQAIPDYTTRTTYNNELDRQRKNER